MSARTRQLWSRIGLLIILTLTGGLIASQALPRAPLPSGGGLVFAATDRVGGIDLAEWSARQWQWTLSQPIQSNPGQDVTGERCGREQTGPVFFLPHNFPPCQVPANTLLLVPIVGTECSSAEPPPYHGTDEQELRACATSDVDRYTNISVRIDGEAVVDITSFRVASPMFTVTLPEQNVLGVPAGPADVVADGYQMLVAPLPPGEHEIMVHVELVDGTVLPDKVIHFTVVKP